MIKDRIISSLKKGFIDESGEADEQVRSRFLTNDKEKNISVLETIKNELRTCNGFIFSIAFITESGLNELKSIFIDLNHKGISGKLITSDYLSFNSPKIFSELLKIKNLEVRITESEGFHSKGYLFQHEKHQTLIMGSSNLTSRALKINYEWNLKVSSLAEGELVNSVLNTIEHTWKNAKPLSKSWIDHYGRGYKNPILIKHKDFIEEPNSYETEEIVPNKMQESALKGIQDVRDKNEKRALVVSATGTGKTYLAAFDVKRFKAKKLLFIAHRDQILNQAIQDFKRVLGNPITDYGKYSGNKKSRDKQYVFATIQTISRDKHLKTFDIDEFDYIIIDEVHKAGADSYLKVINYFQPELLMGMTATPERTDDINIFKIFDYNIAYEIRLQEAIEEDMLCDFHYFGVVDYEHDDEVIDDTSTLSSLISEERVNHLIQKINYYGHNGADVRGLIFTSRVKEAVELSKKLNQKGYRTIWLAGSHSIEEREITIKKLEKNELDYIITVDIFNEGIDIPSINQIVMMRETQSSIIFTQQLGRGLRKDKNKDFVTIIDFIGNYKNNYLIPMALSGDSSLNKDILRRKVKDVNYISGVSSINFEQIAKDRIFDSIAATKLDSIYNLKKEYFKLKNRLGKIPMLYDFYESNSVDPAVIAEKTGSYYEFVVKYDKEYEKKQPLLRDDNDLKLLKLITKEFINAKRAHEIVLLEYLIEHSTISFNTLEKLYKDKGMFFTDKTINSVLSMFDMSFYISSTRNTYQDYPIVTVENQIIALSKEMKSALNNKTLIKFINDVIKTVKKKNKNKYNKGTRIKHKEIYTRRDVSRLLEWEKDMSGTIFGYSIHDNKGPIFVTYNKHEVESSVDYKDSFINTNTFRWYTRSNRTLESKEVSQIINSENNGTSLYLFVKKDDASYETNFYYLGEITPIESQIRQEVMEDGKPVVRIDMKLDTPISENFLYYLEDRI